MATKLLYFALAVTIIWIDERVQAVTEHRCKKVSTDPLVMEMTLRSDDYVQLAGFTGTATTNCVSEPVTVEGTTWQQLVIRTDANRAQIIPDPATTDCRTSADAVVATKVIYGLVGLRDPPTVRVDDGAFDMSCDSDTAEDKFITMSPAQITGIALTSVTLTQVPAGTLSLALYTPDKQTELTSAALGATAVIKATFSRTATSEQRGANMHSLQFSGTDAFAVNILSLDANGCPMITDPAKSLYLATGFVYDEAASSETEFVAFTPEMEIIAFTGSSTLHIRAQYAPCNDDADSKCFGIVTHCAALKRRKRSAESPDTSRSVTISIPLTGRAGSSSGQGGETNSELTVCEEPHKFWIVAVILGVLLLVATAFSIYLYLRLRRLQIKTTKMKDNNVGITNPTLQTDTYNK